MTIYIFAVKAYTPIRIRVSIWDPDPAKYRLQQCCLQPYHGQLQSIFQLFTNHRENRSVYFQLSHAERIFLSIFQPLIIAKRIITKRIVQSIFQSLNNRSQNLSILEQSLTESFNQSFNSVSESFSPAWSSNLTVVGRCSQLVEDEGILWGYIQGLLFSLT